MYTVHVDETMDSALSAYARDLFLIQGGQEIYTRPVSKYSLY